MRERLRRILSMLLCAALLISWSAPAFAEEEYEYEGDSSYSDEPYEEPASGAQPEVSEPEQSEAPSQDEDQTTEQETTAQETQTSPALTETPAATPAEPPAIAFVAADVSAPVISAGGVASGRYDRSGEYDLYCDRPTITIRDDVGLARVTVKEYVGEYNGARTLQGTVELDVNPGDTEHAYRPDSKGVRIVTAVDLAGNESTYAFCWSHVLGIRSIVETPATCTENRKQTHIYWCRTCGDEYFHEDFFYDNTPGDRASGHDFGELETYEEGCEGAYTKQVCNTCGYVDQEIIRPRDGHHVYEDGAELKVTGAACTHGGHTYRECSVCGYDDIVGDPVPATGHSFGAWKNTREPDCTGEGERARYCQNRGCDVVETAPISPLGHTMAARLVTPAGCTTPGLYTQFCSRCGAQGESYEAQPIGSHLVRNWKRVKEPTCTDPGVESGVCERCGEEDTRLILTVEHVSGSWTTTRKATCTEEGEETATCEVCGQTVTRATKRANHTLTAWKTTKEATCTRNGEQTSVCDVCGETIHAVIPAPGHRMGQWETMKKATCTDEGIETRSCSVCDEEEMREIPTSSGHEADKKNYDCTKPPVCKRCGVVMGEAVFKAHFPNTRVSSDENGHWYKCGNDGCTVKVNYEEHIPRGDGNCLTAERCAVCNEIVTPAKSAHSYDGEWVVTSTRHARRCANGDCTASGNASAHTGADDGDCTSAYLCQDCGYEVRAAQAQHRLTGAWIADGTGHRRACANAGCNAVGEAEPHRAEDDGDLTTAVLCEVCGYTLAPALPALSTPTITSTSNADGGVKIAWKRVSGAEMYRVFYREGGQWLTAADTDATSLLWTGAQSGNGYSFALRCVTGDGENYVSAQSAASNPITYLAQPGVAVADNTDGGIHIMWNGVEGAATYRLYYRTGNGSWTRLADVASTGYTWTAAKVGTKYGFTVQAVAGNGMTSTYDETGVSVTCLGQPALPTAVFAEDGIRLTWEKTAGATSYRVYYRADAGAWTAAEETASTSYTFKDAQSGVRYSFSIQALCDGMGGSFDQNGTSIFYLAQPGLPELRNAASGVELTWAEVPGAVKYTVYYKTGSGKWTKLADTTSAGYAFEGAKAGTKYAFSVQAAGAEGTLSGYDASGASITRLTQPALPSATVASAGVQLTWTKTTGAAKYRVYSKPSGGAWTPVAETTSLSYLFKDAKSGEPCSYSIQAVNGDDASAFDETGRSVTYVAQPALPTASNVAGGVQLTWSAVDGAAKYAVYSKAGSGKWTNLGETDALEYAFEGAKAGTKYAFSIQAVAPDGSASLYNTTGKSILSLTQPALPSASNTAKGVQLTWAKVAGAARYRVYYRPEGGEWTQATETSSTGYLFAGAKSGEPCSYSVQAVNGSDVSTYDEAGRRFTYLEQPALPDLSNTASGVELTWAGVPGATKYVVYNKVGSGKWTKLGEIGQTSYTFEGAKAGTKYAFSVQAIGEGGVTSTYNTTGRAATRLTQPDLPSVSAVNGGIKLSWTKAAGASRYRVYYRSGADSWKTLTETSSTSYTWKTAKKNAEYAFSVQAVGSDGAASVYDPTGVSFTY